MLAAEMALGEIPDFARTPARLRAHPVERTLKGRREERSFTKPSLAGFSLKRQPVSDFCGGERTRIGHGTGEHLVK